MGNFGQRDVLGYDLGKDVFGQWKPLQRKIELLFEMLDIFHLRIFLISTGRCMR